MPADIPQADRARGVTVYHNPRCGTSRAVLSMLEAAGHAPVVVEYLKTGWTRDQLQALFRAAGGSARDFLREKEALAGELRLTGPGMSEDQILDAMVAHPILVNRPIVVTPKGVALCRPAERLAALLDG